ncbi:hypothetical protein PHIN3_12 [Sinorhizobium phage phiN3]|uniref:Uncharacterized protein n=1 Tax=Sinorhizobium phage phiN3 TaxID=1647405 RepID=A0A0F6YQX5_9CAUD|nr:hypothetical protein AVT40_gp012 [Sinorhizobium phage phiN3]AKF13279.1 hypothetical protein PHIN3_12 [Sinorhizobium phage phiN3]
MKFLIPDVGFKLKLTEDFTAKVLNEGRNYGVIMNYPSSRKLHDDTYDKAAKERTSWDEWKKFQFDITFPKDTVLTVARVYIRKGAKDFSSVTFNISETPLKCLTLKKQGGTWESYGARQFWLNLDQVHLMEFDVID